MGSAASGGRSTQARGAAEIKERDVNEVQAEEENKAKPISKPGGYKNDPPDPTNPNEVRERTLKKLKR